MRELLQYNVLRWFYVILDTKLFVSDALLMGRDYIVKTWASRVYLRWCSICVVDGRQQTLPPQ